MSPQAPIADLFLGDDSKLYEGLTDRWLDEGVVARVATANAERLFGLKLTVDS